VFVGEPTILETPATPEKRQLLNRSRRWREWQERKAAAEQARAALEDEAQLPLARPVQVREAGDSLRSAAVAGGDLGHVSFR
jgi:hypothetical protein